MNHTVLMGRTTHDIELRETAKGNIVTNFSLAVQRRRKNADGDYDTDFFRCAAWNRSAEFLEKYVQKGQKIGLVGSLRNSRWTDKHGQKRQDVEFLVESVYFAESKKDGVPPVERVVNEYIDDDEDGGELPF